MSEDRFQLAVIVGSVREGRFGPVVADWFVGQAKQRTDVTVDVIDLADTPGYSASFADRIAAADAFVVVTPEYNHSSRAAQARDRQPRTRVARQAGRFRFNTAADVLLDQLIWWAWALRTARAVRPYVA